MRNFEIKNIDTKTADVSENDRRVKVVLSMTGVKDFDKDIIEATAFDKTLRERGPRGKGLIWHLTDHNPSLKSAVGRFKELYMDNAMLVGVTEIPKTNWGNDVLELYKSGNINQHSIGFSTIKREVFKDDDPVNRYTVIKEIMLYEGSAVLWGANEFTPTLSAGKSLTSEERENEFNGTMADLTTLHKMFKNGHLTDETYELIELKILQLTTKLQTLFAETTDPAKNAGQAVSNEVLEVLKNFNNNLNI